MSVPEITITRASDEAEVLVSDLSGHDMVCVYRAVGHRSNFEMLARVDADFIDEALIVEDNYKYKASFADNVGLGVLSFSEQVLSESDDVLSDGDIEEFQRGRSQFTIGE